MSDEQILEALQMYQALREMEENSNARRDTSPMDHKPNRSRVKAGRASRDVEGVEFVKMPTKITGEALDPKVEFMQACEAGDVSDVKAAIANGVNVRLEDDKGEMPLHKLSRLGLKECAKLVLDATSKIDRANRRIDLNIPDKKNGYSPIFFAASFNRNDMVLALLDWGVDLTVESNTGWNVLHQIVSASNKDMLRDFLAHEKVMPLRAKLMSKADKDGRTPMHIAAFKADEEIVGMLLNNGGKATVEDCAGNTPATLAGKAGRRKSRDLLETATANAAPVQAA